MSAIAFVPVVSSAKSGDDQAHIILLNDAASALEDSDPVLSKSLTEFADEKEKDWEYKNANKNAPPDIVTGKELIQLQNRIALLKQAAVELRPVYPNIANSLVQWAKELNRTVENAN